jgi:prepilin-type N-terminal cleavage/methylation domain-containing protein
MKSAFGSNQFPGTYAVRSRRAFTLVEMLVTMGLFTLVVVGLVYAQMFGMRQDQLIQSKLGASDHSRRGFDVMTEDIRAAKIWNIGNGSAGSFTAITNGDPQIGNALEIYTTTNTSAYVRYYFDTNRGELYRYHSRDGTTKKIAEYLTNTMYFRAEDYRGNVQTTLSHKGVINVALQFYQYQYPLTQVGSSYYYDYYAMQFRITPHVPDGQ